jgi:hypothetical protein
MNCLKPRLGREVRSSFESSRHEQRAHYGLVCNKADHALWERKVSSGSWNEPAYAGARCARGSLWLVRLHDQVSGGR